MIRSLHLENFKNVKDAWLDLGSFSIVVGTNASGKSNLRDAMRFLHGVGRGYSLADILGGKYVDGVLQWSGIRGGTREAAFNGEKSFELELAINDVESSTTLAYYIKVDLTDPEPRLDAESLTEGVKVLWIRKNFGEELVADALTHSDSGSIEEIKYTSNTRPGLTQINASIQTRGLDTEGRRRLGVVAQRVITVLRSMRFFDFSPDAMRLSSLPGQTELGDRGENLSSVLQAIAQTPGRKEALIEWLRALTPMDAVDLEFPTDLTGRTLITLVERRTGAASRLTVRLTALFGSLP